MKLKLRKTRGRVKDVNVLNTRKPLAPIHKSKGVFLSSASSLGRGSISDDKDFDKICPDDSAIIRTNSPHAAGLMLTFWYLRRADDAYTGNECKRKALIRGYSNQGCAHDCSARFALQGVRRSRPRWELSGLISRLRIVDCVTFCSLVSGHFFSTAEIRHTEFPVI